MIEDVSGRNSGGGGLAGYQVTVVRKPDGKGNISVVILERLTDKLYTMHLLHTTTYY